MSLTAFSARCRCPVCNASQDWSEECRRCAADLRFLAEVVCAAEKEQKECLLSIARGQYQQALCLAKRLDSLLSNETSVKLLTVCHLLCEEFQDAVELAKE